MKKVEITCDACDRDITTTGNSEGWRIALTNEHIPSQGGLVTDVGVDPLLDHDCYFCSWRCFEKWVRANVVKEKTAVANDAGRVEFENAKREYYREHAVCPQCGNASIEHTCKAFDNLEMKDRNKAYCHECGWTGRVHDLIPENKEQRNG